MKGPISTAADGASFMLPGNRIAGFRGPNERPAERRTVLWTIERYDVRLVETFIGTQKLTRQFLRK
jgi:acyl CoA:acetate/3-ketoacid CoA transferase beta subunit